MTKIFSDFYLGISLGTLVDTCDNGCLYCYSRYSLVLEYAEQRMWLWPPFSLIPHLFEFIWLLFWAIFHHCCSGFPKQSRESGLIAKKRGVVDGDMDAEIKDYLLKLKAFERRCCVKLMEKKVRVQIVIMRGSYI